MKKCKKCGNNVPRRIVIDGKRRHLNNRIYCLDCSPFGMHNTRQIVKIVKVKEKISSCAICGKEYTYIRKAGHRKTQCASCSVTKHRQRLKKIFVAYKGGKCQICEYHKSMKALQFHHKDISKKDFTIGSGVSLSISRIKKEVDKCILTCANCHFEIHEEIAKSGFSKIADSCIIISNNDALVFNYKRNGIKKSVKDLCSCGSPKERAARKCSKCFQISRRKVERPSFEILITEIENLGYEAIGRKYGVTGNSIRGWIKTYKKEMNNNN